MTADDLRNKLMTAAIQGNLALSIALANHLKLFQAIIASGSEESPASYSSIASQAGLKPRYTKELLGVLACGDIIEVTSDGEHFYIPNFNLEVLSSQIKDKGLSLCSFIPLHAGVFNEIAEVFKKDGPLGMDYSSYNGFYKTVESATPLHKKHLVPDLVPMTGMKEKLENGIEFLDVGCGSGFHICELAAHFPKTNFTGIDITPTAIENSESRKKEMDLQNVNFHERNAQSLDENWTDKFDMITIFSSFHDQCRPDLSIKEIHRVLKPGGTFAMIEIDGTSSIFEDKKTFGNFACAFYTPSVFHCLAIGSNSPDALGMGAMMGTKRGSKLLTDAGFTDLEIQKIPFFTFNVLYLAKK
ncbi:hypothetical protein FO519_008516 [Halicephalobus sp. NKZ332]|nr:hypothetical protein FO519_008516 [Halicephalobus sp. NKZ332]